MTIRISSIVAFNISAFFCKSRSGSIMLIISALFDNHVERLLTPVAKITQGILIRNHFIVHAT
jgi:hypothetical protein